MLGDSVGIQFGQALLESAGGTLENFIILKKLHKTFNLMSILRTSRGNGTFANFRITGFWVKNTRIKHEDYQTIDVSRDTGMV
jgi:hypothetical protein